jgi:hypothetical protein
MARANRREREERSISRGGAEEPDPWIHNGSGCPVVQEVQRERGEARLPGTCINGEPQRAFAADISERAERDAAMLMAETIPGGKRVTLSGDKNYDTQELVRELRG